MILKIQTHDTSTGKLIDLVEHEETFETYELKSAQEIIDFILLTYPENINHIHVLLTLKLDRGKNFSSGFMLKQAIEESEGGLVKDILLSKITTTFNELIYEALASRKFILTYKS